MNSDDGMVVDDGSQVAEQVSVRGAVCFEIVENESIFAGVVEMDLPLEAMLRM